MNQEVRGAKIEWNTPVLVREGCWRDVQVAALIGCPSLGSREVPEISSGEPLCFQTQERILKCQLP